jgi:hypothetical protein
MNITTDIRRASTGTEMGIYFPPFPFLSATVLEPSSADDPLTEGASYSAKLEPVRPDTSDPRIRIFQASVKTLRNMHSSAHVNVLFRASPDANVYVIYFLGEGASTATIQLYNNSTKNVSDQIVDQSKKAIEALTGLADNWNGNGGKAPTAEAISTAKALVERLTPHLKDIPLFYPAPKGGIVAEMRAEGDRLTIILENDFLLGVSFVAGGHEMKEFQGLTDEAVTWVNSRLCALNRP